LEIVDEPVPQDTPVVETNTGEPVNTFSGDAWTTSVDFDYSRIGFPMKFERYFHNGITSPSGELGPGWMSNYDICLYVPYGSNTTKATLVMPHQTYVFTTIDKKTFIAPAGCFYQLQLNSNGYVLTDKNGMVYTFFVFPSCEQNLARLIQMQDLNGNKVVLGYTPWIDYKIMSWIAKKNTLNTRVRLRLQTVSGNNLGVTFSYYDNSSPTPTPYTTSTTHDAAVTWLNTYGNRLKNVTNTVGDTIAYDQGGQAGPVTYVSRPGSLNASYKYYQYPISPSLLSNPITVTTLKQIIDPKQPAGYRNVTYVSENNTNYPTNPVRQIINGMGLTFPHYLVQSES
jgi:hypothetical protein